MGDDPKGGGNTTYRPMMRDRQIRLDPNASHAVRPENILKMFKEALMPGSHPDLRISFIQHCLSLLHSYQLQSQSPIHGNFINVAGNTPLNSEDTVCCDAGESPENLGDAYIERSTTTRNAHIGSHFFIDSDEFRSSSIFTPSPVRSFAAGNATLCTIWHLATIAFSNVGIHGVNLQQDYRRSDICAIPTMSTSQLRSRKQSRPCAGPGAFLHLGSYLVKAATQVMMEPFPQRLFSHETQS
ncbi:hypothetical protein C8R47DRAFT_1076789 [Mycena vitilis]|nr:hypothetical protein C8R47DRAFT_1076789 [Mycena vitilis]